VLADPLKREWLARVLAAIDEWKPLPKYGSRCPVVIVTGDEVGNHLVRSSPFVGLSGSPTSGTIEWGGRLYEETVCDNIDGTLHKIDEKADAIAGLAKLTEHDCSGARAIRLLAESMHDDISDMDNF
jgi:hypothetical protein